MYRILFGLAALMACVSGTAFANGSGYNGPDLKPISIPVQLDRGISVQALSDAVVECMWEGDKAIGLKSTMQNLAEQMGAEVNPVTYTKNLDTSSGTVTIRQIASSWFFSGEGSGQANVSQNVQVNGSRFSSYLFVSFSSGPHIGVELNSMDGVVFPFVSYDKVLQDGSFDDFGNPIPNSRIVSGLKIQFSTPPGVSLARVPLVNSRTQQPSRFTVNGEEYVQCLQSQLQLHAAK